MDPLPTSPDATDPLANLGKPLSLWLDGPELTPPRPALEQDVRAEVCVVGGGITGLTTALLLAREGRSVVLIEREHVGSGSSGANTGKVSSQHGSIYAPITKRYGVEAARTYGRANEEAKKPPRSRNGISVAITRWSASIRPPVVSIVGLPPSATDSATVCS